MCSERAPYIAGDEATSELRRYGVLASIQLCEAFHKVRRLEEESALLAQELTQYVRYCEERVQDLQRVLTKVEAGQRPLAEVLGAAEIENVQRYFCAAAFQAAAEHALLARLPRAICALLQSGIAEYRKHIAQVSRTQSQPPAATVQEAAEERNGDAADDNSIMSDDSESVGL